MDGSMHGALTDILNDYEQRRSQEIAARKAELASVDKFLAGATTALQSVVAPCFEQFAQALKKHNHECTIETQELNPDDSRCDVSIALTIFPDGTELPQGNASLSYIASSHRQRVSAHRSITTRGGGLIPGTIGEYQLTEITRALVDQDLLEIARAVFGTR
jgi:hypothetical protein